VNDSRDRRRSVRNCFKNGFDWLLLFEGPWWDHFMEPIILVIKKKLDIVNKTKGSSKLYVHCAQPRMVAGPFDYHAGVGIVMEPLDFQLLD